MENILVGLWLLSIGIAIAGCFVGYWHSTDVGFKITVFGMIFMWVFCFLISAHVDDSPEDIQKSINKKQQEIEVLQIELKYKENK